jgi:hypothetical protein
MISNLTFPAPESTGEGNVSLDGIHTIQNTVTRLLVGTSTPYIVTTDNNVKQEMEVLRAHEDKQAITFTTQQVSKRYTEGNDQTPEVTRTVEESLIVNKESNKHTRTELNIQQEYGATHKTDTYEENASDIKLIIGYRKDNAGGTIVYDRYNKKLSVTKSNNALRTLTGILSNNVKPWVAFQQIIEGQYELTPEETSLLDNLQASKGEDWDKLTIDPVKVERMIQNASLTILRTRFSNK